MKKYKTSNVNYTINIAQTQTEILNENQESIPQSAYIEAEDRTRLFYGPKRNVHTYSVLSS